MAPYPTQQEGLCMHDRLTAPTCTSACNAATFGHTGMRRQVYPHMFLKYLINTIHRMTKGVRNSCYRNTCADFCHSRQGWAYSIVQGLQLKLASIMCCARMPTLKEAMRCSLRTTCLRSAILRG